MGASSWGSSSSAARDLGEAVLDRAGELRVARAGSGAPRARTPPRPRSAEHLLAPTASRSTLIHVTSAYGWTFSSCLSHEDARPARRAPGSSCRPARVAPDLEEGVGVVVAHGAVEHAVRSWQRRMTCAIQRQAGAARRRRLGAVWSATSGASLLSDLPGRAGGRSRGCGGGSRGPRAHRRQRPSPGCASSTARKRDDVVLGRRRRWRASKAPRVPGDRQQRRPADPGGQGQVEVQLGVAPRRSRAVASARSR